MVLTFSPTARLRRRRSSTTSFLRRDASSSSAPRSRELKHCIFTEHEARYARTPMLSGMRGVHDLSPGGARARSFPEHGQRPDSRSL
ncbi:hypothetical protein EVAR_33094_1 [Eumeta japonica]|uniref:Uncharacterized protein n=1 Tax=Eumeta variegata TaxID=151549 RepID=A0A4C1YAL6_EUMVA|nr:hypothetical protein EVAR_33094_1 [Eumeta japonica]